MTTKKTPFNAEVGGFESEKKAQLTAQKIEMMKSYLRGYGRADKQALLALVEFPSYQLLAREVIAKRRARLLELFDDETLALIASGDLSVRTVAAEIAFEMGLL